MEQISYDDFQKIDIRVGRIIDAQEFPLAKKPAYKLTIDFGNEIGIKKSSAQITRHYRIDELIDKQVFAVVNFPSKRIADFVSEVLVLGIQSDTGGVVLAIPEKEVPTGVRLY